VVDDAMTRATGPGLYAIGLSVRYGGVVANDDISLGVPGGAVVGLIGPNGAGKTTFVDAISGFTPARGQVWMNGHRIDGMPAHHRTRQGLSRTWQSGELFNELTVAENVLVAGERFRLRSLAADSIAKVRPRRPSWVHETLDMVGLRDAEDRRPQELSLAEQKLLGVARALAARPSVLLLDEPAAGLDRQQSRTFGAEVRRIAERGVAVLLIEHDVSLVLDICDELVVLDFGRVIASGQPDEVVRDKRVVAAYLGGSVPEVNVR
jgi:branched-chain amino acid transport system ATP-binding protein